MNISVSTNIAASSASIWQSIIDIDNCQKMIEGIIKIEILERPTNGIIGLKWKETREMFGKEADETMWITEAVENQYYMTQAESHGSIYRTKMSIKEQGDQCRLTMEFGAEAQSLMVKVVSALMSIFLKKTMIKLLKQDLADIKKFVENKV